MASLIYQDEIHKLFPLFGGIDLVINILLKYFLRSENVARNAHESAQKMLFSEWKKLKSQLVLAVSQRILVS